MRIVPTEMIPENAILGDTLFTLDGRTLLRKGAKLSLKTVEKINSNSIFTVYIDDEHSDVELNQLIDPNLRQTGIKLIKNVFEAAGHRNTSGELKSESIFGFVGELNDLIEDVLYELSSAKNQQLEYIDIKNVDNYLYSSAFNTAILSVLIGWEIGLGNEMIRHLFMGALFHDIGLALLPNGVIYKKGELSKQEKIQILMHPKTGHTYLKEHAFLSAYVKAIALQHHEHIDGSGYPNRTPKNEIHQLAQIVGIADIYDAMTSDRPYRRALSPSEAIEYILGTAGRHYDLDIVNIFVKKINPYPSGSLVKLNTGQVAVVDMVPKELPLRPDIRVISRDEYGYSYRSINLRENNNITIESMYYGSEI